MSVALVIPIAATAAGGGGEGPQATASASVKKQVKKLKRQIKQLQQQVDGISQQPGPQGPQGDQGPQGPAGPSTGPAGGDLTGAYPNPSIAGGSIGTPEFSSSIPTVRALHSSSQEIVNDAQQLVALNDEEYDSAGMHNTAMNTQRLTAPVDGVYAITADVQWETNNAGVRAAAVIKNEDEARFVSDVVDAQNGGETTQVLAAQAHLQAGDYAQLLVFQNSGGPLDIVKTFTSPVFTMTWLAPGP